MFYGPPSDYSPSEGFKYFKNLPKDTLDLNVAGGGEMPFTYTDKKAWLGEFVYNKVKTGEWSVFLLGEMEYWDKVEDKTKTYRFMTKSTIFPKQTSRIIINNDEYTQQE
jgi:hypothetical protein